MRAQQHKIKTIACFGIVPMLLLASNLSAQMGVGTRNPANPAEVVTDAGNIIIDNTGKIGVQVANPKTAVDLRSGTNGAVAIGYTDKMAAAAGAGAIRYNPTPALGVKGYLEFSDGTSWISYFPKGKPHIVVMAVKNSQDTQVFETGESAIGTYTNGLHQRSSSYLTNWTQVLDSDSGTDVDTFNPATGEFVAPRAGIYYATFTFCLASSQVNTGSNNQTEAIWEVRDSSGTITQRVKAENGYSSDTGASPNAVPVGSACTVAVYMNQGDRLRPFAWITTAFTGNDNTAANIRQFITGTGTSAFYNTLTILEQ